MVKMYRILINGRVHGVGFRCYIESIAKANNLLGTVRNVPEGVEILVNDPNFMNKLDRIPALARIEDYTFEEIDLVGAKYKDFRILESDY